MSADAKRSILTGAIIGIVLGALLTLALLALAGAV